MCMRSKSFKIFDKVGSDMAQIFNFLNGEFTRFFFIISVKSEEVLASITSKKSCKSVTHITVEVFQK